MVTLYDEEMAELCEYEINSKNEVSAIYGIKIPNDFTTICEWLEYHQDIYNALLKLDKVIK